jgi:hypothetical protein
VSLLNQPAQQKARERRRVDEDFASKILTWAGAYTISFIGLIHLLAAPDHFQAAPYLGWLFLANFVGAAMAAIGISWGTRKWGWLLGDLLAGGAFIGFLVSRIIGLPGFPEGVGSWNRIDGILSLILEVLFISLSVVAITPWGRTLLRVEQKRIEQQEQAAAIEMPGRIEREMSEIRSRIAPNLFDLREHVEPQAIKDQVKRILRKRLGGLLSSVKLISKDR